MRGSSKIDHPLIVLRSKPAGSGSLGKTGELVPQGTTLDGERCPSPRMRDTGRVKLPRKASKRVVVATVPQTDTGRLAEHAKALGIILVKELGKIAP